MGAILAAANARVIDIDRRHAIARGFALVKAAGRRSRGGSPISPGSCNFGHDLVDGVVCDLGVSSMQIDEAERGFSLPPRRAARHAWAMRA